MPCGGWRTFRELAAHADEDPHGLQAGLSDVTSVRSARAAERLTALSGFCDEIFELFVTAPAVQQQLRVSRDDFLINGDVQSYVWSPSGFRLMYSADFDELNRQTLYIADPSTIINQTVGISWRADSTMFAYLEGFPGTGIRVFQITPPVPSTPNATIEVFGRPSPLQAFEWSAISDQIVLAAGSGVLTTDILGITGSGVTTTLMGGDNGFTAGTLGNWRMVGGE